MASEQAKTLHQLLDEMRAVAKQLTDEQQVPMRTDDGKYITAAVPSLLEQLRDAVGRGDNGSKSARRSGSPEPISLAALDLYAQLESDAAELHRQAMTRDGIAVEQRITALVGIVGRWTEPTAVQGALQHLHQWVKEIRTLLDPPRRYELTAPCPACNTRMVWRTVDGERVQVPALTVDGTVGCTCLACHHVWPPAQLEHLALVIGCNPIRDDTPTDQDGHAA